MYDLKKMYDHIYLSLSNLGVFSYNTLKKDGMSYTFFRKFLEKSQPSEIKGEFLMDKKLLEAVEIAVKEAKIQEDLYYEVAWYAAFNEKG